ncbi:LysM peptidoglycan-binding domain-containing protein [Radiobacillus deserti]|uniref:LysM peptidoglycan-binding domain-containing protein n=1 Tax=Radiobacillus deserti TaxID=2594883 RepID=A0A516KGU4_9BACI|nr:LysM domain-containing protein [Radiobacillus deserti]QDP40623.1 LysM peptidoglycan-binding domain-containing protein [Radiobacillus deserti]
MELLKKLVPIVLIILFLMSIYKDLTGGVLLTDNQATVANQIKDEKNETPPSKDNSSKTIKAVEKKVKPGDTVLSIVEELNNIGEGISIQQIQEDFKILNPGVDPNNIQIEATYLFPIYKED